VINEKVTEFEGALRREGSSYGVELTDESIARLGQYYSLVQKWNPRLHLVGPCSADEFATRHVLESLTALKYLPEQARIADIGSGAGLPIIPCLIARPELSATLIEASPKKAVFLREAIAQLGLNAEVTASRFETILPPAVGYVTCRALERFSSMLVAMMEWAPGSARILLFGGEAIEQQLREFGRAFTAEQMPRSVGRYLFVVTPKTA
jgi:16S rRNA (guanine527-N7)-methyltransferase